MTLNDIFGIVGMNTRNFAVDYRDKQGVYYHKGLQMVSMCDGDIDNTIAMIKDQFESKGYIVYCIVEVFGNFTVEELERDMTNENSKTPFKVLFADKELIRQAWNEDK